MMGNQFVFLAVGAVSLAIVLEVFGTYARPAGRFLLGNRAATDGLRRMKNEDVLLCHNYNKLRKNEVKI